MSAGDRQTGTGPNWWNIVTGLAVAIAVAAATFAVETKVEVATLKVEVQEAESDVTGQWKALADMKAELKGDLAELSDKIDDIRDRLPPKYNSRETLRLKPGSPEAAISTDAARR